MELNAIFLLEHGLELRVLLALFSIIGAYGLVRLFAFLAGFSSLALDFFRKASIRPSAVGAR